MFAVCSQRANAHRAFASHCRKLEAVVGCFAALLWLWWAECLSSHFFSWGSSSFTFVSSDTKKIYPLHLENISVSNSLWLNGGSDALDNKVDLASCFARPFGNLPLAYTLMCLVVKVTRTMVIQTFSFSASSVLKWWCFPRRDKKKKRPTTPLRCGVSQ